MVNCYLTPSYALVLVLEENKMVLVLEENKMVLFPILVRQIIPY
jgi:hypothetical protein